jgi:peptidoglycan hydrolase-like protein with peptidoglycan-binding domain
MSSLPPRFTQNAQLRAAASNAPPLRKGSSGDGVRVVQQALVDLKFSLLITTRHGSQAPDGIFGEETDRAVKLFQTNNGLALDGVVGRHTLARLAELLVTPRRACDQPFEQPPHGPVGPSGGQAFAPSVASGHAASFQLASFSLPSLPITLPTSLRFLTAAEIGSASAVFGSSLNFATILISNALGLNKRPFTIVGPLPGFITLNMGSSFSTSTLIHELTHAWQSQHHPSAAQYMVNAVASQALAAVLGQDAYKYTPGKAFGLYAAEQIAQQVEDGVTAVISHVKSAVMGLPDAGNIVSLSVPRCE